MLVQLSAGGNVDDERGGGRWYVVVDVFAKAKSVPGQQPTNSCAGDVTRALLTYKIVYRYGL